MIDMAKIGPSSGTMPELQLSFMMARLGIKFEHQVPWGPKRRWKADFSVNDPIDPNPTLIDVHGRHWHCLKTSKMSQMSSFWRKKLKTNAARD